MLTKAYREKLKNFLINNLHSHKEYVKYQEKVKKALIEDQKRFLSEFDKRVIQKFPGLISYQIGKFNVTRSILGLYSWNQGYRDSDDISYVYFDINDKFYPIDNFESCKWSEKVFDEIENFRNSSNKFYMDSRKIDHFIENPNLTKEFVEKWITKF